MALRLATPLSLLLQTGNPLGGLLRVDAAVPARRGGIPVVGAGAILIGAGPTLLNFFVPIGPRWPGWACS